MIITGQMLIINKILPQCSMLKPAFMFVVKLLQILYRNVLFFISSTQVNPIQAFLKMGGGGGEGRTG